jgi:hypothetical protein
VAHSPHLNIDKDQFWHMSRFFKKHQHLALFSGFGVRDEAWAKEIMDAAIRNPCVTIHHFLVKSNADVMKVLKDLVSAGNAMLWCIVFAPAHGFQSMNWCSWRHDGSNSECLTNIMAYISSNKLTDHIHMSTCYGSLSTDEYFATTEDCVRFRSGYDGVVYIHPKTKSYIVSGCPRNPNPNSTAENFHFGDNKARKARDFRMKKEWKSLSEEQKICLRAIMEETLSPTSLKQLRKGRAIGSFQTELSEIEQDFIFANSSYFSYQPALSRERVDSVRQVSANNPPAVERDRASYSISDVEGRHSVRAVDSAEGNIPAKLCFFSDLAGKRFDGNVAMSYDDMNGTSSEMDPNLWKINELQAVYGELLLQAILSLQESHDGYVTFLITLTMKFGQTERMWHEDTHVATVTLRYDPGTEQIQAEYQDQAFSAADRITAFGGRFDAEDKKSARYNFIAGVLNENGSANDGRTHANVSGVKSLYPQYRMSYRLYEIVFKTLAAQNVVMTHTQVHCLQPRKISYCSTAMLFSQYLPMNYNQQRLLLNRLRYHTNHAALYKSVTSVHQGIETTPQLLLLALFEQYFESQHKELIIAAKADSELNKIKDYDACNNAICRVCYSVDSHDDMVMCGSVKECPVAQHAFCRYGLDDNNTQPPTETDLRNILLSKDGDEWFCSPTCKNAIISQSPSNIGPKTKNKGKRKRINFH